MIGWLASLPLKAIASQIAEWDLRRREATTESERIRAQAQIEALQTRQGVLIEETKFAATRWIRPAFASIALVYWAKLIIWDTLLGLGTTPYPGDHIVWFVTLIPTAYFLTRPFEKWKR